MESKDSNAGGAPPPETRRGSGSAIYEKYLNIKSSVLSNDDDATVIKNSSTISNSTDQQELEAGEVVSTEDIKVACTNEPSGDGVSGPLAEPEMVPQAYSHPQQTMADTPHLEASAASSFAKDKTQLTAVGTSCASGTASAASALTTKLTGPAAPRTIAPTSSPDAAFKHARASNLSNDSSPSNKQYAAMQMGGPNKMTHTRHPVASPMMGGPGGPSRGRSRSRDRNEMPGNMNGRGRTRSLPRGPPEGGRIDVPSPRDNRVCNGPLEGLRSPRERFNGRIGSSPRNGFDERPGNSIRNGFGGRPGSPSRGDFNGRPGSPPRGDFNERPGSPPRNGFNGRPNSPPRGGNNVQPGSPPRGGFDGRRPANSPRGEFNGYPGNPPRGEFNVRGGSPPRGGFNKRLGSPPRGGFNGRPGSPPRGDFNRRLGSPPRNSFTGGRGGPFRDGYNGSPRDGPRGRSPPRNIFRRGPPMSPGRGGPPMSPGRGCPPMSPGRGGPPRDFRDGPESGRGSPPGRGMMGGHGPSNLRRSRSPQRGPPRSPFRNGNGFGPGPGPDQRPRFGGPQSPPRGPGRRSPPRGGPNGQNFDTRPSFDDRSRGLSPMGRPPSPMHGGGFGHRFDDRGPPGPGPSPGRDGTLNMNFPRGRSRSPNRPSGDMMRKRDRSWERSGPPPDLLRRPFIGPGPLSDSPRNMEPRPFDAPSEWNFELKRSGKVKCRCSATSLSVGLNRQLPLYLDVVMLPHLSKSSEFLQLERPNVHRFVYELKPESMADASGYREFVDYLIQGRSGHARAGGAAEMDPQGFKVFILPPGQAARQLGYKGDHMVAVLRSR